jgi:hypothetical protein
MFYTIGSILLYLEKFMQILYSQYKFVQYIAFCCVKYVLHNSNYYLFKAYIKLLPILGKIPIMSRFLFRLCPVFYKINWTF